MRQAFRCLISSIALVSLAASTKPPRPPLEQCKCLIDWPHHGTEEVWNRYFGLGSTNETGKFENVAGVDHPTGELTKGYGALLGKWTIGSVPYGTKGCYDMTDNNGGPGEFTTERFLGCVPDTSNGPCIGFGIYDNPVAGFLMECTDTETNEVRQMTSLQKRAAAVNEYEYTRFEQQLSPPCACDGNFSTSAIAELYCGADAHLLEDQNTHQAGCSNPVSFDNTANDGDGRITDLFEDGDAWCKVQQFCAKPLVSGYEACTDEHWMQIPSNASDLPTGIQMEYMERRYSLQEAIVEGLFVGRGYSLGSVSTRFFIWGGPYSFVPMTFMPENTVPGESDLYDLEGTSDTNEYGFSDGWKAAIAQASKTYEQYEAPDDSPECDEECKFANAQQEQNAEALYAATLKKCEANSLCSAKRKAVSCETILRKSFGITSEIDLVKVVMDRYPTSASFLEAAADTADAADHCKEAIAESCTSPEKICSNKPANFMKQKQETCEEKFSGKKGQRALKRRCQTAKWVKNKYCQKSCALAGYGYDNEVC